MKSQSLKQERYLALDPSELLSDYPHLRLPVCSAPRSTQLRPNYEPPFLEILLHGASSSCPLGVHARTHSALCIFRRAKNVPRNGDLWETLHPSSRIESVGLHGSQTANRSRDLNIFRPYPSTYFPGSRPSSRPPSLAAAAMVTRRQ